ncbi:MAG: Flp family type IVb pilin [Deltaproteobacteria bacterium]|nr:Flp family type IVb pilin [Deltaproteobacteria bacterium]
MQTNKARKFIHNNEGVSAIEYAIIAALVALAILVGASALGTAMNNSLEGSANDFSTAVLP